ncbi:30S ribosomal protein S8 [Desulfobulbus oligotrophicus]|uniref:Small ribosomal subunit protein uS8 n=1 Tax=Desulfobulbus oligotrophicus TaxID=1909699 RepID=A0A7T6AQG3_9BACT|nr:30S ribosomal protein S8 [Desulfobulbus oligotrophicus]QQG65738.1 30S ribosomal protein S8 [Desulfobulbus oligotrophicus]
MSMSDPLADMLTRVRNATKAGFSTVEIPLSNLKVDVAKVMKQEGYIADYSVNESGVQGVLKIDLKYGENNETVIKGLRRVSKPGCRRYHRSDKIPKVMSGLGVAILTTSKGVITDKQARQDNVGGELLCEIW